MTNQRRRLPIALLTIAGAILALMPGCMKMKTQQATLQHSETVVTPEIGVQPATGGTPVVLVPTDTDRRN